MGWSDSLVIGEVGCGGRILHQAGRKSAKYELMRLPFEIEAVLPGGNAGAGALVFFEYCWVQFFWEDWLGLARAYRRPPSPHVILRGTSSFVTAHNLQLTAGNFPFSHLQLYEPVIVTDMAGQSTQSQVTPYLVLLVFIATLGPLQFGYHLV